MQHLTTSNDPTTTSSSSPPLPFRFSPSKMLTIKASLVAFASFALFAQAAPTVDIAYETEDGQLDSFQVVSDQEPPSVPGITNVAYETEDGQLDYFQFLDQTNETAVAEFSRLVALEANANGDPGLYHCGGSSQCGVFPKLAKYCDHAKQYLDGSRTYGTAE
jgi:hypothetical protein